MKSILLQKIRINNRFLNTAIQVFVIQLIFPVPKGVFLPSVIIAVILGILLQYKLVNRILSVAKNNRERLAYSKIFLKFAGFTIWGAVVLLVLSIFESTPEQRLQSALVGNVLFVIGLALSQAGAHGYMRYEEYLKEKDLSEHGVSS